MREKVYYKKVKKGYISCVFTEPKNDNKAIVIMAHGFRSSNIGSSRKFVSLARSLADNGIASLRFDQLGSGNSSGDFYDSSFNNWVETIRIFVREYIKKGYRVALMGDSMGATAVINSLDNLKFRKNICGIVLWVPDPKIDIFEIKGAYVEEGGQRVKKSYWVEACGHNFIKNLESFEHKYLIVYGEKDKHISELSRKKVIDVARKHNRKVVILKGEDHSNWSYPQMEKAINNTADFFEKIFTISC